MIARTSDTLGTIFDFQFLVISDLAAKSICVTTVRKQGGKLSIPKFNNASPGFGGFKIPVIRDIHLNTLFQKLVRCLHDQNTCRMFLTSPHVLQHSGEFEGENLDNL